MKDAHRWEIAQALLEHWYCECEGGSHSAGSVLLCQAFQSILPVIQGSADNCSGGTMPHGSSKSLGAEGCYGVYTGGTSCG